MNSVRSTYLFCAGACAAILLAASSNISPAATIGGWDSTRGDGYSAILTGSEGIMLQQEVATHFPGTTLAETSYLSASFLNSINVLYIGAVHDAFGQIVPLDSTEQTNLQAWVAGGGRALLVTDNPSFSSASNSMIGPFGLSVAGGGSGIDNATVTDHTSFPAITDGPFGTVSTLFGGYVGGYSLPASAPALAYWNNEGQPALAAMNYGSGRVVFYADDGMMSNASDNRVLLDNVLTFEGVPEPSTLTLAVIGLGGIALLARRRVGQTR